MHDVFICDGIRTPIGRYAGALSPIRTDTLATLPIKALMKRHPDLDWQALDDLYFGCANQSGEDNRNIARMAVLLADLPVTVPGLTLNRLCGSGLDAIGSAARVIKTAEAELMIAGGVESMSRAPFVMGKAETAFGRTHKLEDTTLGWRFINPLMEAMYGVETMSETAENVAKEFNISRDTQDAFALRSQLRYATAAAKGFFTDEICPVAVPQKRGEPLLVTRDEHPRETSIEALSRLKPIVHPAGTITAGNASGINDGAAALLLASQAALTKHHLQPRAKIVGMAAAGVAPRIMGMGPLPATKKVLQMTGLSLNQMDVIELNEAFASQAVAVLRELGLSEESEHVNPNGGAIAVGHPLGASGARIVLTALRQLEAIQGRYALCTMCIGVGQGIALIIERV